MPAVVDAAAEEDKPFGQYSALRAALHQVKTGARLTDADRRTLRALRDRVGHKSDRCSQLIKELLGES